MEGVVTRSVLESMEEIEAKQIDGNRLLTGNFVCLDLMANIASKVATLVECPAC